MTTAATPARRPPKPGTPEHALLAALAADDPAAVQAARLALVVQWTRYQWKTALKWWVRNDRKGDREDYFAWVRAGWWEAALRFRPELGWRFATYASRYSLKYLTAHAHREAANGVRVPMGHGITHVTVTPFGSMGDGAGEDRSPAEHLVPDRAAPDAAEPPPDPVGVWRAVSELLPNQRQWLLVWYRYRCGWTLGEIAAEFGVSKEAIRQMESRAMTRLRAGGERLGGFLEG